MKKLVAIILSLTLFSFSFALAQAPAAAAYTITLLENPTTGFSWTLANSDESILTVTDNGYVALPNPDKADGMGGTHTWVIAGKAEGEATITLTYSQSWEGGDVSDTLVYTLKVGADLAVSLTKVDGIPELYTPTKDAVLLNENPTTGYTWSFQASAEGIVTLEKDEFIAPKTNTDGANLLGAGGYHVWVFDGTAEGDVTLTFQYARSWEKDVEPEATVIYTYHVDKDLNVNLTTIDGDYEEYDPMMATTAE